MTCSFTALLAVFLVGYAGGVGTIAWINYRWPKQLDQAEDHFRKP